MLTFETSPVVDEGSSSDATYINECCRCIPRNGTSIKDVRLRRPSSELPASGISPTSNSLINLWLGEGGSRGEHGLLCRGYQDTPVDGVAFWGFSAREGRTSGNRVKLPHPHTRYYSLLGRLFPLTPVPYPTLRYVSSHCGFRRGVEGLLKESNCLPHGCIPTSWTELLRTYPDGYTTIF